MRGGAAEAAAVGVDQQPMSWVKLDDKRATNAKLRKAGLEARGLDEAAICWSAHEETDGFISSEDVQMLAILHGCSDPERLTSVLVGVGRWDWDAERNGWQLRNFLDYNPSRFDLETQRRKDRERKRKGRPFQAESLWNPEGVQTDSSPPSRPVPSRPDPSPNTLGFADFWAVYPLKAKRARVEERAWPKALTRATAEVIIEGARRYRDDPNRDPKYTAHPSTWLNDGRWDDDPEPSANGNGKHSRTYPDHFGRMVEQ